MLQPDEIKLNKKDLIGKKLRVLGHRNDVGLKQKPMSWVHIAYEGQPSPGRDASGKKTVIGSDRFLDSLRAEGLLDDALIRLESFERPSHGFWFYKYLLLQKGKSSAEPEAANQPREAYRGKKTMASGAVPPFNTR